LRQTAIHTRTGGPVPWIDVASAIWRVNPTPDNWYRNRARLVMKLRRAGLPDLLALQDGLVWLQLRAGVDRLELADED